MRLSAWFRYRKDSRPFAALRGCDLQAIQTVPGSSQVLHNIKMALTARVRAILFGRKGWQPFGGLYNPDTFDEAALVELNENTLNLVNCPASLSETDALIHWMDHLRQGVDATALHKIWGGLARRIIHVLDDTTSRLHRATMEKL